VRRGHRTQKITLRQRFFLLIVWTRSGYSVFFSDLSGTIAITLAFASSTWSSNKKTIIEKTTFEIVFKVDKSPVYLDPDPEKQINHKN
jgi:hypothetical protein